MNPHDNRRFFHFVAIIMAAAIILVIAGAVSIAVLFSNELEKSDARSVLAREQRNELAVKLDEATAVLQSQLDRAANSQAQIDAIINQINETLNVSLQQAILDNQELNRQQYQSLLDTVIAANTELADRLDELAARPAVGPQGTPGAPGQDVPVDRLCLLLCSR